MPRSIKYLAVLVAAAFALVLLASTILGRRVEARLGTVYQVPVEPIEIPSDAESVERGRHLVSHVYLCQECHGEDLEGQLYLDDPLSGTVSAANLTSGLGGSAADYDSADWVRAIRHGIDPEGKAVIIMPSNSYYNISDADVGAIVAYLQTLEPIDNELPERRLGLLTNVTLLGDSSLIPAEMIDHEGSRPAAPARGVTMEYGEYLTRACTICHGSDLSGGPAAGAGLDLTGSGNIPDWTESDFIHALRTGERPRGQALDPRLMPYERIGGLTDDELSAIWLYLMSLQ